MLLLNKLNKFILLMINRFSGAIVALASVVFTAPLIAIPNIDGQLIA